MKRIVLFVVIFTAGVVVGGGVVERYYSSHDEQVSLSRKLRCQKLGTAFVQRRGGDYMTASLGRIDYSSARRSCIAEEDDTYTAPSLLFSYNVIDVVTGQVLFASPCKDAAGECSSQASRAQDTAFERSLQSAGDPATH